MRDDLPRAMREAASQLEPDVVRLAAGGVSRGTRMRRVERIAQVLGSVLAVAVVFAGAVLFGPHRTAGSGSGTGAGAGDGGEGVGGETYQASGSIVDTSSAYTPSPTGIPRISDNELASALKSSLQGTGITGSSYTARGTDSVMSSNIVPQNAVTVGAQLSAQHHIGSISVTITGGGGNVSEPGIPQILGDGSTVYVSQIRASVDHPQDNRATLEVTLVRRDGSRLSAVETNSRNEKSAAAPGAPLLFTADQVTALLDGPVWDAAVAAAKALPPPADAGLTSP